MKKVDEIRNQIIKKIENLIQEILQTIFRTSINLDIKTLFDIHQKKTKLQMYIKQLEEIDGELGTNYIIIDLLFLLEEEEIIEQIKKASWAVKCKLVKEYERAFNKDISYLFKD